MLVKACLNGSRDPADHPNLPTTPEQLAAAMADCVTFGAGAAHLHPRDTHGRESLHPDTVAAAVAAVRLSCPDIPIGVTTGAWIVPDPWERLELVRGWAALPAAGRPDFASVNLYEEGWQPVADVLLAAGIGVEAGIAAADDPAKLAASGLAPRLTRVLVEPASPDPDVAIATAGALVSAIAPLSPVPPLVHGADEAAWPVLEWALDQDYDTRIGLEDTLTLPDGNPALDNATLVAAVFAYLMEWH